ncbi:IclR family transcriptional regulator [Clostridiaceae bacterium M8S5]|nr:IclR family transcriptional regulator [Clostridiaceae bacterium M8S5]
MNEVNNSVIKAIKILELFEYDEKLSIADIYDKTTYSKSAINRILTSFEVTGYVQKNKETGKYYLTNKLYHLGNSTNVNKNIIEIARPHIEELMKKVQLTVSLSIIEDYRAVILYQRKSNKIMRVTPPVGYKSTLNGVASGKVLVAFSKNPAQIIDVMDFGKNTSNTITDKEKYLDVIYETKKNGYAYEDEETELGLFCLAAPVVDKTGVCICSISISGYRKLLIENLEQNKIDLLKCTEKISKEYCKKFM